MNPKAWMLMSASVIFAMVSIASATETSLIPLPYLVNKAAFIGVVEITSVTPMAKRDNDLPGCDYRYRAKSIDALKGTIPELSFIAGPRRDFMGVGRLYFLIALRNVKPHKSDDCNIAYGDYYILSGQPMLLPLYPEGEKGGHTWVLVEQRGGVVWKISGPKSEVEIHFRHKPLTMDGKRYTALCWKDFRKLVLVEIGQDAASQGGK